jgi:NADH-quinone oxidoreductase subunit N
VETKTVLFLLPEMVLVAVATFIYVAGAFLPGKKFWAWVAVGGLLLATVALDLQYHGMFWSGHETAPASSVALAGPLSADLFGMYVRFLVLAVGLMFVLLSAKPLPGSQSPEIIGSLLLALAGTMLVGSANDLVLIFVGLELISIPTYVLLYLGRRDAASQESAVKYFFLSILSSALMLYGFSFLYGAAGSTELTKILAVFEVSGEAMERIQWLNRLALVLIVAGLGFKITAVPFHFYAPDVYQGTTHGNAAVLAVLPKIAGFVALVRIVVVSMSGLESFGWRIALILAVLTMTLGNVLALWQNNVRRLLAYSSIAHAGYMLIGLAAGFATVRSLESNHHLEGIGAMLFYLSVYSLATAGTFAALAWLGRDKQQVDNVDELAGVGRTHPWTGIAIALFMFSLAGIPPLAGFWGKFTLFSSAIGVVLNGKAGDAFTTEQLWFLGLAIVGVLNAAIAAAYYLRIVSVMYFRPSETRLPAEGGRGAAFAMVLCAALVVLVGVLPGPLVTGSNVASRSAFDTHHEPAPEPAKVADVAR